MSQASAGLDWRVVDGEPPAAALAVRREVFVEEQGVPESRERDGRDDEAVHVVGFDGDGDEPVTVARLRRLDGDVAKAERVAVVADRRGEGLGRAVMAVVEATAAGRGCEALELHAQLPVAGFYERLGYEREGEEFEDAGIPHVAMRTALEPTGRSPPDAEHEP